MIRIGRIAGGVLLALGSLPASAADPVCEWPMYGRDPANTFAQSAECSSVTPLRTPTLRAAWFLPTADSVTASAAVAGDTVYIGSWDGTFYALPTEATGLARPRWTYTIDDTNGTAFGRIVSSAAVADVRGRRVVVFAGGATLYALDAASGGEVAKLCLDPRADPAPRCRDPEGVVEIESSPVVIPDGDGVRILVGIDVHNDPGVGRTGVLGVTLDDAGLRARWKFDPESSLTYTDDASKAGVPGYVVTPDPVTFGSGTGLGCGGVWASPAVDVTRGLAYFGTASCSRDGGTGWETLVAVDVVGGGRVWSYRPPRSARYLDDDFGASPNLLPGGLVGNGGKDGRYYALDATTGAVAWIAHAGQAGHLFRDFSVGGMIGTAAVGEVGGAPAIFATTALSTPIDEPLGGPPGPRTVDATLAEDPGRMLSLHAIRASDGVVLWRTPLSRQSYGAPVYTNGVVLVPSTFDATLKAFHADTGALLWTAPLGGAPSSAPVVVGRSIYVGTGTRTTDAEFKAFGGGAVEPLLGDHVLSRASGVWAFEIVG